MKIIGVIPARFGATRLPGKPLIEINGKPLIQWVIEGARSSEKITDLLVATDHQGIADVAEKVGVKVALTPSDLPSGSDRVWAAIEGEAADVVVNIQGDEPLITGDVLDQLVAPFANNSDLEMATLARTPGPEDLESPHTAKIVLNNRQEAIYFSRHPIPFSRIKEPSQEPTMGLIHIGMYAYKKSFLRKFCTEGSTAIERAEGLEQLRALYLGAKIQVVQVEHKSFGVDTPDDVNKIGALLEAQYGRS